MNERDRMIAGESYRASDPELLRQRVRARNLLRRYNAAAYEGDERHALLVELLAEVGRDVLIETPFHCDYGWNITIGTGAFLNFNCVILDPARVTIGPYAKLGPSVQLCTASHPTDPRERERGSEFALPIVIGRNVWIGAGVIVGPGVVIGDDSIIGAGSVVLSEIPRHVLAAGTPCRVIRELPVRDP
jgi:maltose O-acetyltransferase